MMVVVNFVLSFPQGRLDGVVDKFVSIPEIFLLTIV